MPAPSLIASLPPAVIPTVTILGPLAFLAWLFPAVFGGLAVVLRRWRVLFATAGVCTALYFFSPWLLESGSARIAAPTLALVGAGWSWWRHRTDGKGAGSELPVLILVSLAGFAAAFISWQNGVLWSPAWRFLLVTCAVVWAGTLYTLAVRLSAPLAKFLPHCAEPVMLAALAVACAAATAVPSARPPDGGVAVAWVFEAKERGAIISTPLVAGDRVYVSAAHRSGLSDRGAVYCVDRQTGKMVWQFDNGGRMLPAYSSPCLTGGRLHVGEGMHAHFHCRLYCLDAADGHKLWDFEAAGHVESSPCVADANVFFGAGDDGLLCLDAATGQERWRYRGPFHIDSSPAVAGGRVYAGSGVSRKWQETVIFCLDAATGRVVWREATDLPAWGSPVVDGGDVFFGLGNGRLDRSADAPAGALCCVDALTGKQRWRYPVPDGVLARASLDAGRVYFGARDGNGYCLDRASGTLIWRVPLGSPVVTRPALDDGRDYFAASAGVVCCLDAAGGGPLWSFDAGRVLQAKPVLYSSPVVIPPTAAGEPRRVVFGAELQGPFASAAVLLCLRE